MESRFGPLIVMTDVVLIHSGIGKTMEEVVLLFSNVLWPFGGLAAPLDSTLVIPLLEKRNELSGQNTSKN